MNRTNMIIFILISLLSAFGLSLYFQNVPIKEQPVQEVRIPPPEPVKNSIVHYPVLEPETSQPAQTPILNEAAIQLVEPPLPEKLPSVQESDERIQESLKSLFESESIFKLLVMENFIQRFVATVDNLPEKRLPRAHLPIKTPGGKFIVAGTLEAPQTSSRNNERYDPYLQLLESINQDIAVKIYTHFYPLFQSAYEQLGYKNAYFNDRLVYVIEHLLETPSPPDPIQLTQPAVLYTYANPAQENLSTGQKLLLRIGQDRRDKVFTILSSYRTKLTNLQP